MPTLSIATMNLSIVSHDDLSVFSSNSVIFSRIGDSGEENYCPGTMTMFSVKSRNFKGQIVAHNYASNILIFNGIIPGNVSVVPFLDDLVIRFGKVPSFSYVDENGKPILTLWKMKFSHAEDFKKCFSFMLLFSDHGQVVNKLADVKKELSSANKKLAIANKKMPTMTKASKNITSTSKKKSSKTQGKKNCDVHHQPLR